MTKQPKRIRVTKRMVSRALDQYMNVLDWGHLAGPWVEHEKAMRVAINDLLNGPMSPVVAKPRKP